MASSREAEEAKEKEFGKRVKAVVQEHQLTAACGECDQELHSLEEAIAHFEYAHPVAGDVQWVSE